MLRNQRTAKNADNKGKFMDTITTIQNLLTCNGSAHPAMVALTPSDGRLIASAPELLECLRWYVENDEVGQMEGNEFWLEGKARAEAAIGKATGETP